MIETFLQPIVDIKTRKPIGHEALTRGRGRLRAPERLFHRAYEQGKTIELDLTCIQSALKILPKLNKTELLFVNVEPLTLSDAFQAGGKGDLLLKKILPHGQRIVFEITEGMKGRYFERIEKGVKLLRKYGCQFAIDDVTGLGFKLFLLLSLKPDFVKIDISIVRGVWKNHFQRELLQRILTVSRGSGAKIIAEGLEVVRDVNAIAKLGIPFAQGFYFGRPRRPR